MTLTKGPRQTFTATFRGTPLRWASTGWDFKTTSVYPRLYAVVTYPRHKDGSIASLPVVVATYATTGSCAKEIRQSPLLRQWPGQTFVVVLGPGTTEITDADTFTGMEQVR
jgi:hypothetical protein